MYKILSEIYKYDVLRELIVLNTDSGEIEYKKPSEILEAESSDE